MTNVVDKVVAFVTRKRNGVKELLLFRHPRAGVQIPAGTVEDGESLKTALKREVYEETGLRNVKIEKSLSCVENELGENERIIAKTTQVYSRPSLCSIACKEELTRGLTVNYNSKHKEFTLVSYIEYDSLSNATCIRCNVAGWVPSEHVSARKTRYFSLLTTLGETAEEWEVASDRGHIFKLFWTPISSAPRIIPPQDKWLDYVCEEIR